MDITIRPAMETDLEAILFLYNDAILHTTAVYDYVPHTLTQRREWWLQKMENNQPVLVATMDATLVGYSTYGAFRNWAAYQHTAEVSVYIHPEYHNKGIAKLLYADLIEQAKHHKLHTLVAGIDAQNEASIKLHQHFNFKQVAHFKEVGYKFDRWLDLLFFQLLLANPNGEL